LDGFVLLLVMPGFKTTLKAPTTALLFRHPGSFNFEEDQRGQERQRLKHQQRRFFSLSAAVLNFEEEDR
jgi:hypothetical protein